MTDTTPPPAALLLRELTLEELIREGFQVDQEEPVPPKQ